MAQEIEIEFKNLLTKTEYDRLCEFLEVEEAGALSHTNHYFETPGFELKQQGAALRIREKNGEWQLTLKEPHPEGLLETHDTLTEQEAASWINGDIIPKPQVATQLNQLGIDFAALAYGGALSTRRIETEFKETIVVLDHSTYNGYTDYELEVEAKERQHGQQVFDELLDRLEISKKQTPNKIKRFYDSM
ncbi:CYTH domain-containing protein [Sediminibacillus dalangtanensis]|uniref:CYTH domain-containing protein n=1 Tax=Sediminibacillus dalangtanensis TaxID=2729421 RepID=A0ABX7VTA1_9BACI|nr:CYTH domain-containing protein [Sediminibacillus dalangtanensis]QTM98698.1 CYTH domain-containing protein [Sediminibacillus dalangtanensis]